MHKHASHAYQTVEFLTVGSIMNIRFGIGSRKRVNKLCTYLHLD